MLAELSLGWLVAWRHEGRTADSHIVRRPVLISDASPDSDVGRVHASNNGRPSTSKPAFSLPVDLLLLLHIMLAVLLPLSMEVLHIIPINHHLKAPRTDLHWLSEDDPLRDSSQLIDLRKHSSPEENISSLFEAGLS